MGEAELKHAQNQASKDTSEIADENEKLIKAKARAETSSQAASVASVQLDNAQQELNAAKDTKALAESTVEIKKQVEGDALRVAQTAKEFYEDAKGLADAKAAIEAHEKASNAVAAAEQAKHQAVGEQDSSTKALANLDSEKLGLEQQLPSEQQKATAANMAKKLADDTLAAQSAVTQQAQDKAAELASAVVSDRSLRKNAQTDAAQIRAEANTAATRAQSLAVKLGVLRKDKEFADAKVETLLRDQKARSGAK